MFVILDLDKTLADNSHRAHFVEKEPMNWDAFLSPGLVAQDTVVPGVERVLEKFAELKLDLVVLTGRTEDLRDTTMRWLLEKLGISLVDDHLLMRSSGNMLTDAEYKREQLLNFKQGIEDKSTPFLIIDDDSQATEMLSAYGVVLKAPECWNILFPADKAVPEV